MEESSPFFEKKDQKTFIFAMFQHQAGSNLITLLQRQRRKSFLVLFFKKGLLA
jgi:hypothetical protein